MTSSQLSQASREAHFEAVAPRSRSDARGLSWWTVVGGLGALYLLQAITPLRLDNDSVVYLHMATSLVDGLPLETTGLPPGYPAMVAILDALGLGRSFVFVLVNCAFVSAGLASAHYLFDKSGSGRKTLVVPLTMLSVLLVRFIPMPLPESMFFGTSLVALAVMTAATINAGGRRAGLLCIALILTALAITIRFVGFALVPAFLWACFSRQNGESRQSFHRTRKETLIGIAAPLVVALVAALALPDSFRKYALEAKVGYLGSDFTDYVVDHAQLIFRDIGGVVMNLPPTQFTRFYSVFFYAGLLAVVWILSAARLRLPRTPAAVYLVSFLVALIVWPYSAPRLWMPITPILIGYLESASFRLTPNARLSALARLYVAWFAFAGLGALAYTTRITLSGNNFPNVYGKAGGMSYPDATTGQINKEHNRRALELMKRYGNPF